MVGEFEARVKIGLPCSGSQGSGAEGRSRGEWDGGTPEAEGDRGRPARAIHPGQRYSATATRLGPVVRARLYKLYTLCASGRMVGPDVDTSEPLEGMTSQCLSNQPSIRTSIQIPWLSFNAVAPSLNRS